MARATRVCAFLALLALPALAAAGPLGIIKIEDGVFVDSATGDRFIPSGFNGWDTLKYAANQMAPSGYSNGQAYVSDLLDKALGLGMSTYRVFIQGTGTGGVLKADGSYDETLLAALDWLINLSNQKGVRLVITLNNLWKADGVPLFENLCGTASDNFKPNPAIDPRPGTTLNATERIQTPYSWFGSSECRQQYSEYMETIFTRVNSISGTRYLDDGAIFAWNVLNEPRCKYCGDTVVGDWYKYAFKYAKSVGVNQLLTTGEEGFFGDGNEYSSFDPNDGTLWSYYSGQHFQYDHSYADFAVVHIWPSNWGIDTSRVVPFTRSWLEQHAKAADGLGKPLVIEEFGIGVGAPSDIASIRDPMFAVAFSSVVGGAATSGSNLTAADISGTEAIQGALVWSWSGLSWRTSDNDILSADSTVVDIITPYSDAWAQYAQSPNAAVGATAVPSTAGAQAAPAPAPVSAIVQAPPAPAGNTFQPNTFTNILSLLSGQPSRAAARGTVAAQSLGGEAKPKAYPVLIAPSGVGASRLTGRRLAHVDSIYVAKSR